MSDELRASIQGLWARRDGLSPDDTEAVRTVHAAIDLLDRGEARVAEVAPDGSIVVNEWLKLAVLLLFRLSRMETTELGPFEYADKIPLKRDYQRRGVRVVPGASARWGSYQAPGVVLMPSYVNIGAYVGENSMVDTWATVGSCAQIGRNVHLSGGVGIGGVLEPPQAAPVIVEDECLIGSRCIVAEGARVGTGTVLGAGCILTGSIPVIDAHTGAELGRGQVPPWSVAISATRPRSFPGGEFGMPCVLVVKRLNEGERHDKSALNDILRDHGATVCEAPVTDLLALTAELVDLPSESFAEGPLVDHLEAELRALPHLEVTRVGDNLVARTARGRSQRLLLVGHTDTVPADGNARARLDGDTLWGLGATDMKGGLAVALHLARTVPEPAVDVTYVFYAREEVAGQHNGLAELVRERPDLLAGDCAVLGEPTDATIEAGCQGAMRFQVTLAGAPAHTARPWMGRNAIHRLGPVLGALAAYEARQPTIDGCTYREAVQAVAVEGGVAGNVVPDRAVLRVHHRFAPDRSPAEAEAWFRAFVAPHLAEGDAIEVLDVSPACPPSLGHPLLAALIARHDLEVRAKLGWTDVARFAELGIPAANFGPGDATIAHTRDERLHRAPLERTAAALTDLLTRGA